MYKAIKLLQKIYKLNIQLKSGQSNPYPILKLIDRHRLEVCQYLGIDDKSTFQDIDNRIKQIKFESQ